MYDSKMDSYVLLCLLVVLFAFYMWPTVDALTCLRCEERKCPPKPVCRGEVVLDACGCCKVCSKWLGEECGGPWNTAGVCDQRFYCLKEPGPNEFQDVGFCAWKRKPGHGWQKRKNVYQRRRRVHRRYRLKTHKKIFSKYAKKPSIKKHRYTRFKTYH